MAKGLLDYVQDVTYEGTPYNAPKGDVTDAEIFHNIDSHDAGISKKELKKRIKRSRGTEYYNPPKPLTSSQKSLLRGWWK